MRFEKHDLVFVNPAKQFLAQELSDSFSPEDWFLVRLECFPPRFYRPFVHSTFTVRSQNTIDSG